MHVNDDDGSTIGTAADAFQQKARRMPEGRAKFLHRYGAFAAAVKLATYAE